MIENEQGLSGVVGDVAAGDNGSSEANQVNSWDDLNPFLGAIFQAPNFSEFNDDDYPKPTPTETISGGEEAVIPLRVSILNWLLGRR